MKNSQFLLIFCVLLSACAKKTYVADSNTFSHQIKSVTDTSAHKTSSTTDKTVTLINRSIDTNIIVNGKTLSGYLVPSTLPHNDASAHFENEDLKLFLHIDKTGKTTATAIPKLKTIKVKAFEHTAVYNNITKTEDSDIQVKNESAVKTKATARHTQKETTGNESFSFSFIITLLLACVLIWISRKFTFMGKLFG